jgi:hypothetical protein
LIQNLLKINFMKKKIILFSWLLMSVGVFSSFVVAKGKRVKVHTKESRLSYPTCLTGKMYNSQQQGINLNDYNTLPVGYTGISMNCSGPYTFTKTGSAAFGITGPASFYVNGTSGQSATVQITYSGAGGGVRVVVFNF